MATLDRKKRERLQRKTSILDAAEVLVIKHGFDSVKMDEIAEAAEVSKGTLYLYFKNKIEIAMALHNRGIQQMHNNLAKEITQDGTGLEIIQRMSKVFFTFAKEHPHFFKSVVFIESIGLKAIKDLKGTETMDEIQQLDASLFTFIKRAIQIGIQDGSIDKVFEPELVTMQVMATTRGLMQQIIFRDEGLFMAPGSEFMHITFEELLDDFLKMLVRSLRPVK